MLKLSVNGDLRQNDSTSLMIFDIPRQLSHISSIMTIEPGDIVLTGTPKGNCEYINQGVGEIKLGDKVSAWIEVDGGLVENSRINLDVESADGGYEF